MRLLKNVAAAAVWTADALRIVMAVGAAASLAWLLGSLRGAP